MFMWVKWIHILSSTLLFGTGLGIAFFMWRAHRRGDPKLIAETAGTVVLADAIFTAPAVVIQLLTGIWMAHALQVPLATFWLRSALIVFFVVGACWLPVLWLQVRTRDLAGRAVMEGAALPERYHRLMRWWFWLGWPAFAGVVLIFWLMVVKPL